MAKTEPPVGISGKSLSAKLGLKTEMKFHFIHPPASYFQWLDHAVKSNQTFTPPWDFVHLFTNSLSELENQLFALRKSIKSDGMIWVSWYKKSSAKPTEITEDLVRSTCLPLGLVDVKVCAVSEEWTGLKLVIRKELR